MMKIPVKGSFTILLVDGLRCPTLMTLDVDT